MRKDDLANEISEILQLPRRGRQGKAYAITTAVVKAMTNALLRGESIRVQGFGIFTIRAVGERRHRHCFYPYLGKGQHSEIVTEPAYKYVHFAPSKPLLRMLND